tara:strand:- start:399 stop:548 length:150 start_codon:yes stop_codon:yes gene_type:complete
MSYGFIESVHESVRERSRETFKYTAEPQTALFHGAYVRVHLELVRCQNI